MEQIMMDGTGSPLETYSQALVGLVAGVAPSLVTVHGRQRMPASGFVWKPGLIVTTEEALTRDDDITVKAADGKRVAATLVGRDASTDVALLRIDDQSLPVLAREPTTTGIATGAIVLATGRKAEGPTAQSGIVALAGPAWRSMRGGQIDQLIRLDFRADPANEGGVVLAANGGVLGMLAVGPRGDGLVIPLSTIDRIASQLESHGHIARGYLGLGLQPVKLEEATAATLGLQDRRALMIVSVDATGPGQSAGFMQGDIVTGWNGEAVTDVRGAMRRLGPESVGQAARLDVVRAGTMSLKELTITARPQH
jgi:S1-C subfamily serine protease